jgi:hypothetical protein
MYQSNCYDCPVGYYCPQTDTSFAIICPKGEYCEAKTEVPKKCPVGTYNPMLGLKSIQYCTPCREGFYCDTVGLSEPAGKCSPGYYCKSGATSATPSQGDSANVCQAGYYCPEGSPIPLKCPVGTYGITAMAVSITSCIPCKNGFYCDVKGKLETEFTMNAC